MIQCLGDSVSSTTYSYSGGRQTAAGGRGVEYTHFDLPVTVTDGVTRTFDYDAQHGRARARGVQGETTLYAGDWFERRAQLQGASEDVIHVYGPSGLLAQLRRGVAAMGWTTEYIHTDHLGSATVTTASDGSVVSEQWFGPFGRRLDAQGRDLPRNTGVPEGLRVGFTGHEQEDTLGLVDMRGRYYDPTQRRFLTPDPIIARPLSTQAFSPYAYVDNNPLSRIDPTGFWGEAADENGFIDEGDWDLSGMDAGSGASGGAGGGGSASGMAADYDDYDSGDMDFDPGEAMTGQDEQAGNDGTDDWSDSGSGKTVARGPSWHDAIAIDGDARATLEEYVRSTVERSPSIRQLLEQTAARGFTVRLHTASSHAIPFGSALVRMGGDPGEHDIDVGDLSTLVPSVTSGGGGTSREQLIAHEIVEAIRELELAPYVTSLDQEERDDAWMLAHEDALDMENQFRSEAGVPGLLIDRTVVAISPGGAALVTDTYDNGHMDFWYP